MMDLSEQVDDEETDTDTAICRAVGHGLQPGGLQQRLAACGECGMARG